MLFYLFHVLINFITTEWQEAQKNCLTFLVGGTLHVLFFVTLGYLSQVYKSPYLELISKYYLFFVFIDVFTMAALYKSYWGRLIFRELNPYEEDDYDEDNHKYTSKRKSNNKHTDDNIITSTVTHSPIDLSINDNEDYLDIELALPTNIFASEYEYYTGTDTKNIELLPRSLSEDIKDQLDKEIKCMICHAEMNTTESITKLQCAHTYHTECLKEWTNQSDSCPCCRQHIATTSSKNQPATTTITTNTMLTNTTEA